MWRSVLRDVVITTVAMLAAEYLYRALRLDRAFVRAFPQSEYLRVVPFERRGL